MNPPKLEELERRSAEFHDLMKEVQGHVDPILATDRHGAIAVQMLKDLVRTARRARDELVALDRRKTGETEAVMIERATGQ